MRRPVVYLLASFVSGIASSHIFKPATPILAVLLICFVIAGAVALLLCGRIEKTRSPQYTATVKISQEQILCSVLLTAVFITGSLYFSIRDGVKSPLEGHEGKTYTLTGYVKSVKPSADDTKKDRLVVQGEDEVLVSIKGDVERIWSLPGKRITVTGKLSEPMHATNPNTFDYALYLKSSGIRMCMLADAKDLTVSEGKERRLTNAVSEFKQRFWTLLEGEVGTNTAAVLFGMIFGETLYMDQGVYDDFQKSGTAHILSVSGIHVSIIYMCMEKLAGRGRRRSIPYNTAVLLMLVFYAMLAGFSPSVVRAAFMIGVHIFSKIALQRYDFTACTAFTAFILLLYNPFYIYNTGFILSYTAVFVLAVVLPAAQRLCEGFTARNTFGFENEKKTPAQKAIGIFLPVIVIQVGMAPLTSYFFNYFSFAAFFVNVPVIFLAGFLLPLGFLMMGTSFFYVQAPFFFDFLAFLSDYPIRLMIMLNHLTAREGIGFVTIPSPGVKLVFLYYFILFFLSCEVGIALSFSRKKGRFVRAGIVLLALFIIFGPEPKLSRAEVVFVDVGQGDCMHIRTPDGKNILIDGGGSLDGSYDVGENVLYPYLMKNGVGKIDLAVISHMHEDHYGGISSLSRLMEVEKILLFEGYGSIEEEVLKKLSTDEKKLIYAKMGQFVRLSDDVSIDIFYPDWNDGPNVGETEGLRGGKDTLNIDENENSLVMILNYRGVKIFNAGDLCAEGEMKLLSAYARQNELEKEQVVSGDGTKEVRGVHPLDCDILKVSHHGSKTSSSEELLRAISPRAAVVQAGRNNMFGHPAKEVIDRLESFDITVLRNDEQGAVLLDIGKNSLRMLDMRERIWKKIRL